MGQKFATYDESGVITGFYDSNVTTVPAGQNAIALTFDEWAAAVESQGHTIVDGVLTPPSDGDKLTEASSVKVSELYSSCAAAITGGYDSDALGSVHHYPGKATDQTNMLGSVTESLLPGIAGDWTTAFWCADGDGVWEMREHTAAQIQKAGSDGKAWVLACQKKLDGLVRQVESASTVATVSKIKWT